MADKQLPPRSAAKTPIWQVTDDSTRTVVLTEANGRLRWAVASAQTCGPWTARTVKYMANSAHPGKDRPSGHFGFAGHNDPVAFRHVQIKRLE